jgi:hypothetical protein
MNISIKKISLLVAFICMTSGFQVTFSAERLKKHRAEHIQALDAEIHQLAKSIADIRLAAGDLTDFDVTPYFTVIQDTIDEITQEHPGFRQRWNTASHYEDWNAMASTRRIILNTLKKKLQALNGPA